MIDRLGKAQISSTGMELLLIGLAVLASAQDCSFRGELLLNRELGHGLDL
jgi:hypothetical protein